MFGSFAPPAELVPTAAHLPFVRADSLANGWHRAPLSVRLALTAGSLVLLPLRACVLALVIVPLGLAGLIVLQTFARLRVEWVSSALRAAARRWIQIFASLTLLVLSVRTQVVDGATTGGSGAAGRDDDDVTVHVSNHVSWIDILVFTALLKPSFVAASFVHRVPVVGRVAQALGCVLVDEAARTSQGGRSGTVAALEMRSRARLDASSRQKWKHPPLLVFPEGTTSNGRYLIRFRSGAFRVPGNVRAWVLHYSSPMVSAAWETIPATQHLLLILSQPTVHVTVEYIGTYRREEAEDPARFGDRVRLDMSTKSNPPVQLSNSSYSDKKEYHANILRIMNRNSKQS